MALDPRFSAFQCLELDLGWREGGAGISGMSPLEFRGWSPGIWGMFSPGIPGLFPGGFGDFGNVLTESRGLGRLSGILYSVGIDSIKLQWFHPLCPASAPPGNSRENSREWEWGGGEGLRAPAASPNFGPAPQKRGLGRVGVPLSLPVSPWPQSPLPLPLGLKNQILGFFNAKN